MFSFILPHLGTLVTGLVVLAGLAAIVAKLVRDKRQGKTGCSCGCAGCQNPSGCDGG